MRRLLALIVVCSSLSLSAAAQHGGFASAGHSSAAHFRGSPVGIPHGFRHGVPGHGSAVSLLPFSEFGAGIWPAYPFYADDWEPDRLPAIPQVVVVREAAPELRPTLASLPPSQAKMIEVPVSANASEERGADVPATLVLRDGTEMTVRRYTIMGQYLYDSSRPRHTTRIPLDQLDLEATERVNAQNGVAFAVPTDNNEVVVRF